MELQAKVYTRTNDSKVHYARIVVPKDLRSFVAKPALWRSLSTKDKKEAIDAGCVVAASTLVVLQEVADAYCESALVTVATELVGSTFDLADVLDDVPQEKVLLVAKSLREKLGVKEGGGDSPNGGSKSSTLESFSKDGINKTASNTNDAGGSVKMEQGSLTVTDDKVAQYIEKRPHGIYRFRFWIPRKLHDIFGQREVRRTLKTDDENEAIVRARPLLEQVLHRLHQLPTSS